MNKPAQLLAKVAITMDDSALLTTTLYDSLSASISKFEKLTKGQRFMTQQGDVFEIQEVSAQLLAKSFINKEGVVEGMEDSEGTENPYNLVINIHVTKVEG